MVFLDLKNKNTPVEDTLVKFGDLAYYDDKIKEYIEQVAGAKAIKLTHAELVSLRDGKELVPGQWYQITDFVTTTCQPHTRSVGHRFDILVMAIDTDHLSVDAYTTAHDFHVDPETHLSPEINLFTGVPYSLRDDVTGNIGMIDGVYDKPVTYMEVGAKLQYHLDVKMHLVGRPWSYYWYGKEKLIWVTPDGGTTKKRYQYVGEQTINGTTYYEWSAYSQVYTLSDTPAAGDTLYDVTGTAISDTLMKYIEVEPRGIITWMYSVKFRNETGYDYYSIQFERDADFIAVYGDLSGYRNIHWLRATDGYYYTFNFWYNDELFDAGCFTFYYSTPKSVYILAAYNKIPSYHKVLWNNAEYDGFEYLPNNIMFAHNTGYDGTSAVTGLTYNNVFSNGTYNNTFGSCNYNNLGECNFRDNVMENFNLCEIHAKMVRNVISNQFYRCTIGIDVNYIYNVENSRILRCRFENGHMYDSKLSTFRMVYSTDARVTLSNTRFTGTNIGINITPNVVNSLISGCQYINIKSTDNSNIAYTDFHRITKTLETQSDVTVTPSSYGMHYVSMDSSGNIVEWNDVDIATPMSTSQVHDVLSQV